MAYVCITKQPMWWWAKRHKFSVSLCCSHNLKSPCCTLLHVGVQFLWRYPFCQDWCVHQLWCRNVSVLLPCYLCTEGGTSVWGCSRGGKGSNLDIEHTMAYYHGTHGEKNSMFGGMPLGNCLNDQLKWSNIQRVDILWHRHRKPKTSLVFVPHLICVVLT